MTSNFLFSDWEAPADTRAASESADRLTLRRPGKKPFRCVVCKRKRSVSRRGRWCARCKERVAKFRLIFKGAGDAPPCPEELVNERIAIYQARAEQELDMFAHPSSTIVRGS